MQRALGYLSFFVQDWANRLGGSIEQVDGLTNAIQDLDHTTAESQASSAGLAKAMQSISSGAKTANEDLSTQVKRLRELGSAQAEIANAEMALALAEVDAGEGSEIEKMRRRNAIRKQYAEEDFRRTQTLKKEEIRANQQAINDSVSRLRASEANVRSQRIRVDKAQDFDAADAQIRAQLTDASKSRAAAQDRLEGARETAADEKQWLGFVTEGAKAAVAAAEKEVETYTKLQTIFQERRAANQAARQNQGIGNTEDMVAELAAMEEATAKLSASIAVENKQRLESMRLLNAEIATREKLYELKTKTEAITTTAEITKAESSAERKAKIAALQLEIDRIKASGGDATAQEQALVDLQTPPEAAPGRAEFDKQQIARRNREERERQQQAEARQLGAQASSVARENAINTPGRGPDETTQKINEAVSKLSDGATASELTGVADSLQVLADAVIEKDQQRGQEIDKLIAKIDQLAGQIKSNR